ncbi:MAG: arsenate reductase [Gammaproteobacteria bacterium]
MSLTLYGLPNCDTCRKARKWMEGANIDFDFIDYRAEPVPAPRLKHWARQLGGWGKLINKASTTWRQLPDALKNPDSDARWTHLVADHPTLVRRPVLEREDGSVSVGFSEDRFKSLFGTR